ncbi:hypothetical protein [Haloprofundus halobius]|uniref:hypothetical protein n=1 Tax=Haloprofundus halobius TaxID=2876194 RepID=UPI001CCE0A39|nr:hypothetical protein [Haloprofundus halobius]
MNQPTKTSSSSDSPATESESAPSKPDGVTRTTVGYALLFSIPVGIGVAAGVSRATGEGLLAPGVALPGVVAAVGVFLFVLVVSYGGAPE